MNKAYLFVPLIATLVFGGYYWNFRVGYNKEMEAKKVAAREAHITKLRKEEQDRRDAIEKAKINTEAAGQIIHFVNRDFFDFTHDYRFDEIFTNMPFAIGRKTEEEIYDIYEGFFRRAKSFLEKEGKIIMYTHNRDYVIRLAKENGYVILKEFNILAKEETQLFIIK